jgi:hypothetical protein
VLKRSGLRIVVALALSIIAVSALAGPAAAETITQPCSGKCGDWQVDDSAMPKRGANCVYGTSYPYKLNKITIRPPIMHSYYSSSTKVQWRYMIQRKNVNGGSWNTYYTSTYQSAEATKAMAAYAGNGFSRRTWNAPSNPAGYFYRVALLLRWWDNGGPEGSLGLRYEWYKAIRGNSTHNSTGYCLQSY